MQEHNQTGTIPSPMITNYHIIQARKAS